MSTLFQPANVNFGLGAGRFRKLS